MNESFVDHARNVYAPPNDPVFALTPPEFTYYAEILFKGMGSPLVDSSSVWAIYQELLERFEHLDDAADFAEQCQIYLSLLEATNDDDDNEAPTGHDLLGGADNGDGDYYMGGVNNGRGLGKHVIDLFYIYISE